MRYSTEDYFDLMFEDFKIRKGILDVMEVEGANPPNENDPDGLWRDPACPPSPYVEFYVFPLIYRTRFQSMWT